MFRLVPRLRRRLLWEFFASGAAFAFECKPKTLYECAAGSYFTATGKDNTCTSCGEHCNQDQCMTIYGSYPGSGNSVCCPAGMEQWGDGSACRGGGQTTCKLFSNPNLPLCSSVSAHGTQLVECSRRVIRVILHSERHDAGQHVHRMRRQHVQRRPQRRNQLHAQDTGVRRRGSTLQRPTRRRTTRARPRQVRLPQPPPQPPPRPQLQRGSSTAAATCCLRVRRCCLSDAWLTAFPSLFSFKCIFCVPLIVKAHHHVK